MILELELNILVKIKVEKHINSKSSFVGSEDVYVVLHPSRNRKYVELVFFFSDIKTLGLFLFC